MQAWRATSALVQTTQQVVVDIVPFLSLLFIIILGFATAFRVRVLLYFPQKKSPTTMAEVLDDPLRLHNAFAYMRERVRRS